MDANVVIDIGIFDPGTDILDPLHHARAHLLLADGVLTIADFEGRPRRASSSATCSSTAAATRRSGPPTCACSASTSRSGCASSARATRRPICRGKLDALVKVKGSGRSAAEILASLDGDLRMHMRDAAVSHLAVEAAGIDLAQALGMLIKGDDALPIQCNVADLDIVKGVARPKVFVVNTRDSTIWIDGTVSFRDESLDLRFVVSPKDFSPLTLRTPVRVRGTLGNPAVSLELGKLAGKAGAAGLLSLLHPLAAIIPFIDPGSKKDAAQTDANAPRSLARAASSRQPVRMPKSAHVPPAAPAGARARAVGSTAAASAPAVAKR